MIRIGAPALCALAPLLCPAARADEPPASPAIDQAAYDAQLKALQARHQALPYDDYASRMAVQRDIAALKLARYGRISTQYFYAVGNIAYDAYSAGKFGDELPARQEMLAIAQGLVAAAADPHDAAFGDDPPYDTMLYAACNLADALEHLGRGAEAIALLEPYVKDPANDRTALFEAPYVPDRFGFGPVRYIKRSISRTEFTYASLVLKHGGDLPTALFAARQTMLSARLFRKYLGTTRFDDFLLDKSENQTWTGTDVGETKPGDFGRLYADAAWSAGKRDPATTEDVFVTLQDVSLDRTTRALGRAAAENAVRRHGAETLLARRDKATAEADALLTRSANDSGQMSKAEKDQADARITELDNERDALDVRLAAVAPEYFALTRPKPLSAAEAQALLKPGEAALFVVPSAFGVHVFLVDAQGVSWHRSDLPPETLNRHVRRLLWDVGGNVEVSGAEDATWRLEGSGQYPFDFETSHLLYRELVEPFATRLKDTKFVYVVATGALSSLPFSILVSDVPSGDDGDPAVLRVAPWLGDRYALLQLPSLQTLQLLRAEPPASAKADRLLGFGDPVLEGEALDRGGSPRTRGTRSGASMASAGFSSYGDTAGLADPASLRTLARLPGTARELKALQEVFGPQRSRIQLAEAATETAFKHSDLKDLSVLALSTHGLVAGEAGAGEPGLVLTPPAKPTRENDGYLTTSEIAGLDIDADWVILSACNTAAGDGSEGASGLSGLVRAFFFAGARSVLASHWPVKDAVAERMIPLILSLQREHPDWTRAEALRAAEKAIRDDTTGDEDLATWAHPSAWAPFTLIGDAGG